MHTRKEFLIGVAALVAASAAARSLSATRTIGLGVNTFAFKRNPFAVTISEVAAIGFDAVELSALPEHPTEPARVSAAERRQIRQMLGDHGLALPQIFERIPLMGTDAEHRANLERLRRDAAFAHDVNARVGGIHPDIGTHLYGDPDQWEVAKDRMIERLREWAKVGQEMETIIAIKGHNRTLMDTSAKTQWIVRQVNSPWLRVVFDYSHYQNAGEELGAALERLFPYTCMVSLQDGRKYSNRPGMEPLLPGDGTVDYPEYFRRLLSLGYDGYTTLFFLEPSAETPAGAARRGYGKIAAIMKELGVRRPGRGTP
jgi:sugar phosphate isomerase/epimerase